MIMIVPEIVAAKFFFEKNCDAKSIIMQEIRILQYLKDALLKKVQNESYNSS